MMAFLIPRCHRIKIRLICPAVTENPVIHCLFQRFNHAVRRSEIHIRHPERQNIIRFLIFFLKIMLDRPSMGPIDRCVKIVLHRKSTFLLYIVKIFQIQP